MKKIIFLTLLLLLYQSCDITENRFVAIKNDSKNNILCFISKTDINNMNSVSEMDNATEINKSEFAFLVPITRGKWEDYIEKCDAKKARIYIIEKDSINKYGWDKIHKNNIYNKKYEFTIGDLEKINWEITYK